MPRTTPPAWAALAGIVLLEWVAAAIFFLILLIFHNAHPEELHGAMSTVGLFLFYAPVPISLFGSAALANARLRGDGVPRVAGIALKASWWLVGLMALSVTTGIWQRVLQRL